MFCFKKMKKIFNILFILSFLYSSEIKERTIDSIKSFFNEEIEIFDKKFKIPKKTKNEIQNKIKQNFFRDQIFYWIIKKNKQEIGYALLDNSIGKSMPITYLVIFNANQEIIHSEIIKYRESYGGEVSGKSWLNQFNGMTRDSLYTFPKDIAGISGATISVRSVTKGFSKLSLLLPYIIKQSKNNAQAKPNQ
tara:strand:- start:4178 stop:4753 length:576 start_codon:yes stop_codon:yes gene_type:complete